MLYTCSCIVSGIYVVRRRMILQVMHLQSLTIHRGKAQPRLHHRGTQKG